MSKQLPPCLCPNCGKLLDAATDVDGDSSPSEGDYSFCLDCAVPLMFNKDLTVRSLTALELAWLPDDVKAIQHKLHLFNEERRKWQV